jgi:hypothetical protein
VDVPLGAQRLAPGGTPHVADYGVLDVPSASMAEELAILSRPAEVPRRDLRQRLAGHLRAGDVGERAPARDMRPSPRPGRQRLLRIDGRRLLPESGRAFLPAKGFGVQQLGRRKIAREPGYEPVKQPAGTRWWRSTPTTGRAFVHARLQTPRGQPGGLTLFHVRRRTSTCRSPSS